MAYVTQGMRQKMASDAAYERELRGLKRQGEMVPVPFEWLTRQTRDAVQFPTYGWVPKVCIAWAQRDTGLRLPWSCGREGDQLLIASRFVQ